MTTKEIASALDISTRTVETHRYQIRKKIGLKDKKISLRKNLLRIY
jgi:DNA-binding CsgD family transcriptional regulator